MRLEEGAYCGRIVESVSDAPGAVYTLTLSNRPKMVNRECSKSTKR